MRGYEAYIARGVIFKGGCYVTFGVSYYGLQPNLDISLKSRLISRAF